MNPFKASQTLNDKTLYLTFSDGKATSTTRERYIDLIYTFEDLEIVNGFTPNGDDVNDKWVVVKPGREEDLDASTLQIFSKEGILVFESKGFKKQATDSR